MRTDAELVALIPDWLVFSQDRPVPTGLARNDALEQARVFCGAFSDGAGDAPSPVGEDAKDVAHALVGCLSSARDGRDTLTLANTVYQWIETLSWGPGESSERLDLLRRTAEIGWGSVGLKLEHIIERRKHTGDPDVEFATPRVRSLSLDGRALPRASLIHLFEQCDEVTSIAKNDIPRSRREAVKRVELLDADGRGGLFDEKHYFRGELCRLAAAASRMEGHWDQAEYWLKNSEAEFGKTLDAPVGFAKVAYLRLGLLYQRYRMTDVLESASRLREIFGQLGLSTYRVKCEIVEAMALKESSRPDKALTILENLSVNPQVRKWPDAAVRIGAHLADSYKELGRLGDGSNALKRASEHLSNVTCLATAADFKAVCADFLRNQGHGQEAVEMFDEAKADYLAVGMVPLAAYIAIFSAEANLTLGNAERAEDELLWALPVLQQYQMLREGCAAAALLQESIKARRLDPRALRQLRDNLKRNS